MTEMEQLRELDEIREEITNLKNRLVKGRWYEYGANVRDLEAKLDRFIKKNYMAEIDTHSPGETLTTSPYVKAEDVTVNGVPLEQELEIDVHLQERGEDPEITKAFNTVISHIRNDDKRPGGIWDAYQSNIAMAFYDECITYAKEEGEEIPAGDLHELQKVANRAADRFLRIWTMEKEDVGSSVPAYEHKGFPKEGVESPEEVIRHIPVPNPNQEPKYVFHSPDKIVCEQSFPGKGFRVSDYKPGEGLRTSYESDKTDKIEQLALRVDMIFEALKNELMTLGGVKNSWKGWLDGITDKSEK